MLAGRVPRAVAAWAAGFGGVVGAGARTGGAVVAVSVEVGTVVVTGGSVVTDVGGSEGCAWGTNRDPLAGEAEWSADGAPTAAPGWRTTSTSTMTSPMASRQPKGSQPGRAAAAT